MLRRSVFLFALLAGACLADTHIRPPGPYMASPPPPVDTTPLDPNRKPTTQTAAPGTTDQWFGDWNLISDRSPSGAIQISEPRKGSVSYHASFDSHGWMTELVHFDARRKERWTKLFTYPAKIPAGPGDVPATVTWSKADGSLIDQASIEQHLAKGVPNGIKKLAMLDLVGEPFVIVPENDGCETWMYATTKEERQFRFDKSGKLIDAPAPAAPSPAPVSTPVAPPAAAAPAAAPVVAPAAPAATPVAAEPAAAPAKATKAKKH